MQQMKPLISRMAGNLNQVNLVFLAIVTTLLLIGWGGVTRDIS
jgi:hypothetical protein